MSTRCFAGRPPFGWLKVTEIYFAATGRELPRHEHGRHGLCGRLAFEADTRNWEYVYEQDDARSHYTSGGRCYHPRHHDMIRTRLGVRQC